jgi:hypothetical protein
MMKNESQTIDLIIADDIFRRPNTSEYEHAIDVQVIGPLMLATGREVRRKYCGSSSEAILSAIATREKPLDLLVTDLDYEEHSPRHEFYRKEGLEVVRAANLNRLTLKRAPRVILCTNSADFTLDTLERFGPIYYPTALVQSDEKRTKYEALREYLQQYFQQ